MVSGRMNESLLKECNACGTKISRYSAFCRNCGHPQGPSLMVWLLVVFLLVMLAAYVAFMIYCACHAESFAA